MCSQRSQREHQPIQATIYINETTIYAAINLNFQIKRVFSPWTILPNWAVVCWVVTLHCNLIFSFKDWDACYVIRSTYKNKTLFIYLFQRCTIIYITYRNKITYALYRYRIFFLWFCYETNFLRDLSGTRTAITLKASKSLEQLRNVWQQLKGSEPILQLGTATHRYQC